MTVVDEHSGFRSLATHRRLLMRSLFGLALVLGIPVAGQAPVQQFPSTDNNRLGQRYPDASGPFGPGGPNADKKRIALLNAQRQKSLVSDTEKLLKLAQELNDQVTQSGSATLSDDELRKVAEIGKLAHNVKDKMSYSVGGYPDLNQPLTISPGIQ